MAMDPEIKAKWLKKLRSGEYEQGHRALLKDDKYCCLGVLCNILPGYKFVVESYHDYSIWIELHDPDGQNLTMQDLLDAKLCGIPRNEQRALARMNDNGNSFSQIADYIEKNL